MADVVGQAEVGKEGKGPAGMTCLVYINMNGLISSPVLFSGTGGGRAGHPKTTPPMLGGQKSPTLQMYLLLA